MTTSDMTASQPEQTERERFARGMSRMMELVGDGAGSFDHARLVESYRDVDPQLSDYIVSFAFGDIYSRTALTPQQQTLVTISTLVGRGAEPQLKLHINVGFNVGLSREEITGALIHCIPYVGFPHVLNALNLMKDVLAERGDGASGD